MPADRRARARRARRRAARLLTVCNAGRLATAGHRHGARRRSTPRPRRGEPVEVFACETRPLLQGARLTAWELADAGHPGHRARRRRRAAHCSRAGGIDAVIVGCDRVAANGDVANKIGTYALALAARTHGVPFYVAGPRSTLDAATARPAPRSRSSSATGDEVRAVAGLDVTTRRLEPCLRRDPGGAHHRPDHRRRRAAARRTGAIADRAGSDRGVRAAVYLGAGEVRIEERPVPRPGPGEVLVAMRACGICGSDLMHLVLRTRARRPCSGTSRSGVVVGGRRRRRCPAPGARVFVHHHVPCGDVRATAARGHETLCDDVQGDADRARRLLRADPRAGAQRRAATCSRCPTRVSDDAATLIEPLACCVRGLRPRARGRRHAAARDRRRPDGPAARPGGARPRRAT